MPSITLKVRKVLIWDKEGAPPAWDGVILLWQSFSLPNIEAISLPDLLDQNSERIRKRYLDYIYHLGAQNTSGKSLVDRFVIEPGFSYWWSTLMAQKDVVQYSPHIYTVLKLFLVEEELQKLPIEEIVVHTRNHQLAKVLRDWASKKNLLFRQIHSVEFSARMSSLLRGSSLNIAVDGLKNLSGYLIRRLTFTKEAFGKIKDEENDIAFFDVLTHLSKSVFTDAKFASNYWTLIVDELRTQKLRTIWLHWYYRHTSVPNKAKALQLIDGFNLKEETQFHLLLDAKTTLSDCWQVFTWFLRLNWIALGVFNREVKFKPEGSELNLWLIYKTDWYHSFFGKQIYWNLFAMVRLKKLVNELPKTKLGFYIQENQPWEYALAYYWKRFGHGQLVSIAHTTIPFWDFRYYYHPDTFKPGTVGPSLPDYVAGNGPDAISKLKSSGYPKGKVIELEALRYMHLNRFYRDDIRSDSDDLNLLILGDLVPSITISQLTFLKKGIQHFPHKVRILFKPHPAAPKLSSDLLEGITLAPSDMGEALKICDAVFVNNVTSGAADPYHIGLPLIVLNEPTGINFCPVYSLPNVHFVHHSDAFMRALFEIRKNKRSETQSFFNTNIQLTKWKNLISLNGMKID